MDTILDTPGVIKKPDGSVIRRVWTKEQKRKIAEESYRPDTSVSIVARRYDVNANQVFKWRKEYLRGDFNKTPNSAAPTDFIPLGVIGRDGLMTKPDEKPVHAPLPSPTAAPSVPHPTTSSSGIIEVVLRQGVRVRCKGSVDLSVWQHTITTAARLS